MPEIQKEITINRTAPEVFAYLCDLDQMPERLPTIVEAEYVNGPPLGLGEQFHTVQRAKGRQFEIIYEVSGYEQDRLFAVATVSGTQPFEEVYEIKAVDGGAVVTLTARGEMPGMMRLFSRKFKKLLKKQVSNDLERLKDLLEGEQGGDGQE